MSAPEDLTASRIRTSSTSLAENRLRVCRLIIRPRPCPFFADAAGNLPPQPSRLAISLPVFDMMGFQISCLVATTQR